LYIAWAAETAVSASIYSLRVKVLDPTPSTQHSKSLSQSMWTTHS